MVIFLIQYMGNIAQILYKRNAKMIIYGSMWSYFLYGIWVILPKFYIKEIVKILQAQLNITNKLHI